MRRYINFQSNLFILVWAFLSLASAHAASPKNQDTPRPLDVSVHVDIAPGDLQKALDQLSESFGIKIVYSVADIKGVNTRGAHGELTARRAVFRLLEGTRLKATAEGSSTVVIGAVAAGATASEGIPEILVTASKIMNLDIKHTVDDAQPYYIFNSEQIQQSGASSIGEFLNSRLTQNTSTSQTSQYLGATTNNSTINLRGLGLNETLILIDGRRAANVAFNVGPGGQPDLNGIPLAAVERIEVLPSSASATYGGSALGGVINVILKKNFDGGEVDYTYQRPFDANAPTETVSGLYGFTVPRTQTRVMLTGSISRTDPLYLSDIAGLVQSRIDGINQRCPACLLYAAGFPGGSTPNIASADGSNLILNSGTSLNSPFTYIPPGTAPGANLTAGLLANAGKQNTSLSPDTRNFGLNSALQGTTQTKSISATIRQSLTDQIEAFVELSNFDNAYSTISNPLSGSYFVPYGAPGNPFQNPNGVSITIPNSISGVTSSDVVTNSATAGLIFRLPHRWSGEVDYTWSGNNSHYEGSSLDGVNFPIALQNGVINPFVDTLKYPLNLSNYLGFVAEQVPDTVNDLIGRAGGPIAALPWGDINLTVGAEHRKEGFGEDPYFQSYPIDGNQGITNHGESQSIDNLYANGFVPLVTDKNALPGINALELQIAVRTEFYTVHAQSTQVFPGAPQFSGPQGVHQDVSYRSTNPTFAVKYSPVQGVTLRASYGTAFLPPTAGQLLPSGLPLCGTGGACYPITDPKTGQSYLVNAAFSGNPSLTPQTSKTVDLGLIWEPQVSFLQGLRVDVEHYRIVQPNYIQQEDPSVLQQVVNTPADSAQVTRNAQGLITNVNLIYYNALVYETAGWDFALDDSWTTDVGAFAVHAAATYIDYDKRQQTDNLPLLEYAGYPNDGGEVKLKANAQLDWKYHHWQAGWNTTFWGGYPQQGTPGSPNAPTGVVPNLNLFIEQGGTHIPSQTYHQIYGSYTFGSVPSKQAAARNLLANLKIQLSIINLFDKIPPFDALNPPAFASGLYGNVYGRQIRLDLKKPL